MVATKKSRGSQSESEYRVQIAERSYPVRQRGGQKPPTRLSQVGAGTGVVRQDVVAGPPAKKPRPTEQVAIDLLDRLWASLPLAGKSAGDFDTSVEVARCFVASHEHLAKLAEEARSLLETLCGFHVQSVRDERLDSGHQQEAEEAKVRECMDVAMPKVWLGPELDVNTLAKEPDVAFTQLKKSLQRNAVELVESFFTALEQLVDKGVVGLIEWRTESLCKFHFFRRLLIHVFEGQTTEQRTREFWRMAGNREINRTEITKKTTTKGREIHEHIRHEQQLMNASVRPLDAPDLVIPQDIRRVVEAIPAWLSPFVRVAVGECFRERVIRHVEKDENWEDTKVSRQVYERPVVYYDPAITIGEFVLVGWGQREHDSEMQRRVAIEDAGRNRSRAMDGYMIAGLVFAVGLALVLGGTFGKPGLLWLGWPTMAASLLLFDVATNFYVRSQGGRMTVELLFATTASAMLAGLSVASGILAVLLRTWMPAVLAVILLGFLIPVGLSMLRGVRSVCSTSGEE